MTRLDIWPGDILCSAPRIAVGSGEQALSQSIIEATQDDPFPCPSHTCVGFTRESVMEATWPEVKETALAFYTDGPFQLWHMRWQGLQDAERQAIASRAYSKKGQAYGVGGLVWDGLDRLFHTRAISRALGFDKVLVCSGLAAWASKEGAGRGVRDDQTGHLLPPESVTPDDWVDAARKWPEDLQPLWDNLTAEDLEAAKASWEARLRKQREFLEWAEVIRNMTAGP